MLRIAGYWQRVRTHGVAGTAMALRRKSLRLIKRVASTVVPSLDPHAFLRNVAGVIHVGANVGQEREIYAKYNLKVLWIEPIPEVYDRLCRNIRHLSDQKCVNHLITDRDEAEYAFHVANNGGASSSILDLSRHSEIWPEVRYVSEIMLKSITLDTLLEDARGSFPDYEALVIDTQGSELLVLKGATKSLRRFKFIMTEAPDFESYEDCARVDELVSYLSELDFALIQSDKFAKSPKGGQYFNLLFKNTRR